MPYKTTRLGCSVAHRAAADGNSSWHHSPVLREGQKNANIHIKPGFIWGISAKKVKEC
jgi:hypothetical protein